MHHLYRLSLLGGGRAQHMETDKNKHVHTYKYKQLRVTTQSNEILLVCGGNTEKTCSGMGRTCKIYKERP